MVFFCVRLNWIIASIVSFIVILRIIAYKGHFASLFCVCEAGSFLSVNATGRRGGSQLKRPGEAVAFS